MAVARAGTRIQIWLDHGTTPIIDAADTAYAAGRFGVNGYAGNTLTQHLAIT
ncbi:hypothetical protein [Amycolatopsis sp. NBC_01286]|uniref:hypothetical protein n=1 Tax=Amycolatopsis sp. NBC_01286 TaxID=2903560 RepID=UPI002E0E4132|nr:hypothetical protein OG570_38950 [Amycolatopsis sp. NBC_01286]